MPKVDWVPGAPFASLFPRKDEFRFILPPAIETAAAAKHNGALETS